MEELQLVSEDAELCELADWYEQFMDKIYDRQNHRFYLIAKNDRHDYARRIWSVWGCAANKAVYCSNSLCQHLNELQVSGMDSHILLLHLGARQRNSFEDLLDGMLAHGSIIYDDCMTPSTVLQVNMNHEEGDEQAQFYTLRVDELRSGAEKVKYNTKPGVPSSAT